MLDTKKPHLTPMNNPATHLVYSVKGSDVKTTIINGEVVMEDRRLLSLDLEKTMADIRKIAESIRTC